MKKAIKREIYAGQYKNIIVEKQGNGGKFIVYAGPSLPGGRLFRLASGYRIGGVISRAIALVTANEIPAMDGIKITINILD